MLLKSPFALCCILQEVALASLSEDGAQAAQRRLSQLLYHLPSLTTLTLTLAEGDWDPHLVTDEVILALSSSTRGLRVFEYEVLSVSRRSPWCVAGPARQVRV